MEYLSDNLVDDVLVIGFRVSAIADPLTVSSVLKELARKQKASGRSKVVVDFSGIELFSSGMLGALLTLRSHGMVRGFTLKLTGLSVELKKVFDVTSLQGLFNTCPSTGDAISSFSGESHQPNSLSA